MVNYKVQSPHYVAKHSGSSNSTTFSNVSASGSTNSITIPANQIRSGKEYFAPTKGSYGHFEGILPIPYRGELAHITSNNTWTTTVSDFKKNGDFSPQVDDGVKRGGYQLSTFDSWKAAGEKNQAREYVRVPKETSYSGVIETFAPRKLKLHKNDTPVDLYVHDMWIYDLPNNKVGKEHHQVRNLKQSLTDYYKTNHAQALYSYLNSLGFEPAEDIGYFASGVLHPHAMYAVARSQDGKIIFSAARDVYKYINRGAEETGLSPEEFRIFVLDEEVTHIKIGSLDKLRTGTGLKREEIRTKSFEMDFYDKASKESGGDYAKKRKYEKFRDLKQWDIETTPERYEVFTDEGNLESRIVNAENSSSETSQTYSQNLQPASKSTGSILINMPRIAAEKYDSRSQNTNYKDGKKSDYENNETPEYSRSGGKVVSMKDRRKSDKIEKPADAQAQPSDNTDSTPQETPEAPAEAAAEAA